MQRWRPGVSTSMWWYCIYILGWILQVHFGVIENKKLTDSVDIKIQCIKLLLFFGHHHPSFLVFLPFLLPVLYISHRSTLVYVLQATSSDRIFLPTLLSIPPPSYTLNLKEKIIEKLLSKGLSNPLISIDSRCIFYILKTFQDG